MTEPFSPWVQNNLAFLTGTEVDNDGNPLPGDGWTLVEDYVEPADGEAVEGTGYDSARVPVEGSEEPQPIQTTSIQEKPVEQPAEPLPEARSDSEGAVTKSPSTVSIGGKEYTLDELKKLIE